MRSFFLNLQFSIRLWNCQVCISEKSSKKYKVPISRDNGWEILEIIIERVMQISIDEAWSAFRFRRIEYIKNFIRGEENAISAKGKARVMLIN